MAQPQKSGKPLNPADLPDPLGDSRDVPMASADDLLSEMVGDDVERLMSGEYDPIMPAHRPVDQLQQQLGSFLDELRHRERQAAAAPTPRAVPHVPLSRRAAAAAPPPPPASTPPVTRATAAKPPATKPLVTKPPTALAPKSAPAAAAAAPRAKLAAAPPPAPPVREREEDLAPPLDDLVGVAHEEWVGLHSGEFESADAARGPAESRALLAPVNAAASEPTYLKPLDWIGAPIAAMSRPARIAMSMLAVTSFLGGCAALGYVLMLRHGGV